MTQWALPPELPRFCKAGRREQPGDDDDEGDDDINTTDLDSEHEGDPLVIRSVRSIISTQDTFLLHYALQVWLQGEGEEGLDEGHDVQAHLVLHRDVGAAMDPTIVLGKVRADTLEFTTNKNKVLNVKQYLVLFVKENNKIKN